MKLILRDTGIAVLVLLLLTGADWLQFRGKNSQAVAPNEQVPVSWDDGSGKNIGWKVELDGRGLSGPIVIGDRVVVTSSSGVRQDRLHVYCFDAENGEKLWERQFWATGRTSCHRKMCVATPTPTSDGERIFAFYSSNDVACLDLEGNLLWYRGLTHDYPNASNSLGMASSPLVMKDTLILQLESDAEAFAIGLDVETGLHRWKIDRPQKANWSSPAVFRPNGSEQPLVLLQSSQGLTAVRPQSGEVAWSFNDGASTIPSSTASGDTVFVPSHGVTALRPVPGGSSPELLWQENRLRPSTASPLVYRERVYTTNRAGVLTCAEAETGEVAWQLRLKGSFSATPVAAGNHLYFFNEEGLGQVVEIGSKRGKIVGENHLGETILSTPAIADGTLYIRSDDHLWKISE